MTDERPWGAPPAPTPPGAAGDLLPASPPAPPTNWQPPRPATASKAKQGLIVGVVALLIAAIGGGAYWAAGRDGGHPSKAHRSAVIHYPAHWDARVARLVSFVERQRELTFAHPVAVHFLTEAAFKKKVTTDPGTLTKSDKTDLANAVAFLRALGLIEGHTDLLQSINQNSSESTLAFYSPKDKTITVRGTHLDVATRVTLVHEMTHALQDQHFNLTKLQERDHGDESGAIDALIEGDATTVENAYVKALSPAERQAYEKETAAQDEAIDLTGVPPVVQIMSSAPYEFGPPFVAVLKADGGEAAVNAAFRNPPTTQEYIFDPTTWLRHDREETVAKPAVPTGAKKFDDGNFEPIGWYVVLSEHIDPHEALRATDGWGGDEYVSYRTAAGRACTRIRFKGETQADTDQMRRALTGWVAAVPGIAATVSDEGTTVLFESCDPARP